MLVTDVKNVFTILMSTLNGRSDEIPILVMRESQTRSVFRIMHPGERHADTSVCGWRGTERADCQRRLLFFESSRLLRRWNSSTCDKGDPGQITLQHACVGKRTSREGHLRPQHRVVGAGWTARWGRRAETARG